MLRDNTEMTGGDYARFAGQGALALVEGVGAIGEWAGMGGGLRRWAAGQSEAVGEGLTPRAERVANAALIPSWSQEEGQPLAESAWDVGLPGYIGSRLAQNVPGLLAGGGGGLAARGAISLAGRAAGTTVGAGVRAGAFSAGAAATEGALGAGDALNSLRDIVRQQAQRELGQNASAAAIESRTDELMASTDRWMPALTGAATGALSGYATGRLLGGHAIGAGRGFVPRVAGGALTEAIPEVIEEGASNAAAQAGAHPVTGRDVNWWQAAAAGAEGGLIGSAMGGAISIVPRGRVAPDIQTARNDATNAGAPPSGGDGTQAPTSTLPGGQPATLNAPTQPADQAPAFIPPGTTAPAPAFVPPSTPGAGPDAPPQGQTRPDMPSTGPLPPEQRGTRAPARMKRTKTAAVPGVAPAAAVRPPAASPQSTGLEQLGGAAQAIGANLRSMLWAGYDRGEGAGRSDPYVRAAQAVSRGRGFDMDQGEFGRFSEAFSAARNPAERRQVMADYQQAARPEAPYTATQNRVETPAERKAAQDAQTVKDAQKAFAARESATVGFQQGQEPSTTPPAPKVAKKAAPKAAAAAPTVVPPAKKAPAMMKRRDPLAPPSKTEMAQLRRKLRKESGDTKRAWDARRERRATAAAERDQAIKRTRNEAFSRYQEAQRAKTAPKPQSKAKISLAVDVPAKKEPGNMRRRKPVVRVVGKDIQRGNVATAELAVDEEAAINERNRLAREANAHGEAQKVRAEIRADFDEAAGTTGVASDKRAEDENAIAAQEAQRGAANAAEPEETPAAPTTRADEEDRSDGVQDYAAMGANKKEGRSSLSAKERYGEDLLGRVQEGEMSIEDAVRAYGRQSTERGGRPWKHPTFVEFLQSRLDATPTAEDVDGYIKEAGKRGAKLAFLNEKFDPSRREDLTRMLEEARGVPSESIPFRDAQARQEAADDATRTTVGTTGAASTVKSVQLAPEELARIAATVAPLSPAQLAALKALKAKKAPANMKKAAAPKADNAAERQAVKDRFQAKLRAKRGDTDETPTADVMPGMENAPKHKAEAVLYHPQVNDALAAFLEANPDSTGAEVYGWLADKLMFLADRIPEFAPYALLAQHYRTQLADMRVMTHDHARSLHKAGDDEAISFYGRAIGLFAPAAWKSNPIGEHYISISMDPDVRYSMIKSLLHEAVHPATRAMDMALRRQEAIGGQEGNIIRAAGYLQSRYRSVLDRIKREGGDLVGLTYASNDMEFFTEALSNPRVQKVMGREVLSESERAHFKELGIDPGEASTLWSVFLDMLRWALNLPRNTRNMTMLDYVVRLRDMGGRSDQLDGKTDLNVPVGTPNADTPSADLGSRVDRVLDRLDTRGRADKAWAMGLSWRRLDQLVRDYGSMFKTGSLAAYQRAAAAVNRAMEDFKERHSSTVEPAIDYLLRDKNLGQVMLRATAAGMHPDQAFTSRDHDHIEKNDANRAVHAALRAQFDKLSDEAKRHYGRVKGYFQQVREEEVDAMVDRVTALAAPDASPTQLAKFRDLIRRRDAMTQLDRMTKAEKTALGLPEETGAQRQIIERIAAIHALRNVPGPYFPMNRFGDYVVSYRNKDWTSQPMTRAEAANFIATHAGSGLRMEQRGGGFVVTGDLRGTEFFRSRREAEKRREELAGRKGYEPNEVQSRRDVLTAGISGFDLGVLEQAVRRGAEKRDMSATDTQNLVQTLRSFAIAYMPEGRTKLGSDLQRMNVAGASEDMARVLGEHFNKASARYGYLKEGGARDKALSDMRREIEGNRGASQIKQQALVNELELRNAPFEDSTVGTIAAKASKYGFFWALLSPSLPLVNTMQVMASSIPVLGARYGFGKATRALSAAQGKVGFRAIKEGSAKTAKAFTERLQRNDFNLFEATADHVIAQSSDKAGTKALMDALRADNLVDHTMQMDLHELGGGDTATSKAARALDRLQNAAMMLPQMADVNNKVVVALAAYDLARAAGKNQKDAVDEAVDQLRRSEPVYNSYNKARQFTQRGIFGKWAPVVTQFNQGAQHLYDLLATSGRDAFTSKDPAVRAEARRLLAGLIATHGTFSGLLGLLAFKPLAMALGALGLIAGDDEPWDYERDIRRWLATTVGPETAEIVARGFPRAFGVDLSNRLSLGAVNVPELREFSRKGAAEWVGQFFMGPAGSRGADMIAGARHIGNGDFLTAGRMMAPRLVSDMFKGAEMAQGSRTDARGRTEQTADVGAVGALMQAFGFRPARQAESSEQRRAIQGETRDATEARKQLVTRYVAAQPADRAAFRERIREHNARFPAHRVTQDQLQNAIAERRRQQREGRAAGGAYISNSPNVARWQRRQGDFYQTGAQ